MSIIPNGNSYMKKFLIFLILLLGLTSCGLGGSGDWIYDDLPNNYAIVYFNGNNISFGKLTDSASFFDETISRYIVEFWCNDSYIGLKRVNMDNISWKETTALEPLDELPNLEYYLIDAKNDIQYGPYSISEYEQKCSELGITNISNWIRTDKNPNVP